MTNAEMKFALTQRSTEQKLGDSTQYVPRTTSWSHNGTYMGEFGIKFGGGSRLYVAPGPFVNGFAAVTLDGEAMPLSLAPVKVAEGFTVTRTNHKVLVVTPVVRFTLVNSDRLINVEEASLLSSFSPDLHLDGLLGQTADTKWKTQKSKHWKKHLEEDHMLSVNDLFSDSFSRNKYSGSQ